MNFMHKENWRRNSVVLILIIILGFLFSYKELNKYPRFIHTWAQADRYALALKFTQNDLNFFKPETFVYNHIYPGNMTIPGDTTITAVDFPIHDYIPAVIMKASGSYSPLIFRLYILLYSLLGMFFLYKLSLLWTKNFFKALLVTLLAATSPLFAYYQGGFLPTIPSLANAIIGIYFYSRYINDERSKSFNLAILFLTLAGLSRTTFLIPLIALLGIEFIRVLRKDTGLKTKVIPVALSVVFVLGYWLYNRYLRANYGSMFLANFLPAKDMEEAGKILTNAKANWAMHYFTWIHYVVFGAIILLLVNLSICGKIGKWNKRSGIFGFFILTSFIGTFLFAALLLKQFEAHDYYFLDSFYLPVILLIVLILTFFPLPESKRTGTVLTIVLASLGVLLVVLASSKVKERRLTGAWDRNSRTVENYQGSEAFLRSLGVQENSKIMVIDATSPNAALTFMNHNGYPLKYLTKKKLLNALKWDFDYVVFENDNFIDVVYSVYPDIVKRLKKIGDNRKISVCTLTDSMPGQTLQDLMNLENMTPLRHFGLTFDSVPETNWHNVNPTGENAYSGNKAGKLTADQLYGITYNNSDIPELKESARTMIVSGKYLHNKDLEKCFVVFALNLDGKPNAVYSVQDLKDVLKEKNVWEKGSIRFELPKVEAEKYELSVFLWNVGKNDLLIDDFEIKLY
ncbi:MAG TPA: glycosyltransferase family 39 protein [Prolixibacteraceae bacterium]|nr:glycosyltransferase family 39 protein [Lentimicrobium sp.]HLN73699.1 glycosyltransferase family 39 protein [Prolixibacteraceae bacterium]